ncbi:putative membrane protein SpoIIM required for sporulation [Streptosporangium becharense]|uniref:Putative membrane protein SpoIIM required for sporulation n=1 Tax=Streptosporangium becharense TaxID=1816182 RepID=A0A7W9IFR7_9ACTN|nr:stage II sporulation protein M [Streptosporangium becharense]MBB2909721.1 putative membrane protein SpoIIM required for sporulation [Streptosporangium becharense]MBB5819323.1 putative membrane protein SpoIIM required for sporulation [Streptosporangium becharense]
MDIDAFVTAHRAAWDRLEELTRRRGSLDGAEVDELVDLYQRVATHLSLVRSASADPILVGRLSALVARARSAVTGAHTPAWRELVRFFAVSFPVVAYRARRWWLATTVAFVLVSTVVAVWIAENPGVQAAIATPEEITQLVEHDFADYYSENPAASFAGQVWVNNAWVSMQVIVMAILLGLPIPFILWENALNVASSAGLMASRGKLDIFFGLITPHGLLELTAVFLAAAVGMRLGWTAVDPGPRRRTEALAEQGRAVMSVALGLLVVLFVSGLIEGLVTPSGLPTWARIGIGVVAEAAFLTYVVYFGRRAEAAHETGDLERAPDLAPSAG